MLEPSKLQDEPTTPADRRSSPRGRVLLSGKIAYGAGFTLDCTIRNLSASGACVTLPAHQVAPADLHLIVVRDGAAHHARPAWTRGSLVGLAFEDSHELAGEVPAHLRGLKTLWSALAPRTF